MPAVRGASEATEPSARGLVNQCLQDLGDQGMVAAYVQGKVETFKEGSFADIVKRRKDPKYSPTVQAVTNHPNGSSMQVTTRAGWFSGPRLRVENTLEKTTAKPEKIPEVEAQLKQNVPMLTQFWGTKGNGRGYLVVCNAMSHVPTTQVAGKSRKEVESAAKTYGKTTVKQLEIMSKTLTLDSAPKFAQTLGKVKGIFVGTGTEGALNKDDRARLDQMLADVQKAPDCQRLADQEIEKMKAEYERAKKEDATPAEQAKKQAANTPVVN